MFSRNALRVLFVGLALALCAILALADSQVRAVRLSFVDGKVQIDRGDGSGLGPAYMNMPVTQSTRLQTGDDGRAEVELEDGTAVRLAHNTSVDFPQLSLSDSGARLSTIKFDSGLAYFDVKKSGKDSISITSNDLGIAAKHSSRLRLQQDGSQVAVAVLDGEADVTPKNNPEVTVKKGETFKFNPSDSTQYYLAKGIDPAPSDDWNHEREQYLDQYASNNAYQSSPLSYGYSDLNYYGNFIPVDGYGPLWQPAFVGPGWSPFANGAWAFYPGLGYSWVSAYPWGWLPFHYGSWIFLPNYGWCWQPGFGSFIPVTTVVGGPAGFRPPPRPIHGPGIIPVGEGPRTIFPSGRLEPGLGPVTRGSAISLSAGQNGATKTPIEPGMRNRSLEPQPERGMSTPRSSHPSHSAPHSSSPSVPHSFASTPSRSFGTMFGGFQRGLSSTVSHGSRVH